jgi:hypothetical protein
MMKKSVPPRYMVIAVMTIVLSSAGFAQTYVSQTNGNDRLGTGTVAQPYKSITKALAVASSTGGTISIEAGIYNRALTGDTASLHIISGTTLTFVGTSAGANTTVQIDNGFWLDHPNAVVNMGLSGTAGFNLGSTVSALKLTAGRMNIATGTATDGVTLGAGATLTITNGVLNTKPASGANLSVLLDGAVVDLSILPTDFGTDAITFVGGTNQTIAVPAGGATIGSFTINKESGANTVSIKGGDLVCSGIVTFTNGLILTDSVNALVLTNNPASTNVGFVRQVSEGGASHVVGNVKQNVKSSPNPAFARNEFPVGDMVNYRPAALTFYTPGVPGANFGIHVTVSHSNTRPTGFAGLPIDHGISNSAILAGYPSFFWSIKSDGSFGGTPFNLDLSGEGFISTEFNLNDVGLNRVKIISRTGGPLDVANSWKLLGTSASYDNLVSQNVPTVTAVNAVDGLSTREAIFTYGLKAFEGIEITPAIYGKIVYDNVGSANGIGNAIVSLRPAVGGSLTAITESTGAFSFQAVPPGTYTLTVSKTGNWAGANATDGLFAVRAYAGQLTLDSIATAACDVNNNSTVNATDGLLIVQRYAGLITNFAKGDWIFASMSVTIGTTSVSGLTVKGLAVGDVNKSNVPTGANF